MQGVPHLTRQGAYEMKSGPVTVPTLDPEGVKPLSRSAAGFWLGSVK